jgi:hypothetical protein
MRTPLAAVVGGAAMIALTACSAGPATSPSAAPTSTSAADDCLLGDWHLDTADLASQLEKLLSATTTISDVDAQGDETLTFADGGAASMAADLDVTATVDGNPVSRSVHTDGSGHWEWVEPGATLTVSDWTWANADTSAPQLPMFDFSNSGDIAVTCSADELTLTPAAAPVTGRFTR